MSTAEKIDQAADALLTLWQQRTRCDGLPQSYRPSSRAEGYAVQQSIGDKQQHALFGWKIELPALKGNAISPSMVHWLGACIPIAWCVMVRA